MQVVGKTTESLRARYFPDTEAYKAFAHGFAAGQAEKVHLGVCRAAMFRPSEEHMWWYLPLVFGVAHVYSLQVVLLDSGVPNTPKEIWICRDPNDVGVWLEWPVNSADWHRIRAAACGIPADKVDLNYHLRKGYGEKCD